MIQLVQGVAILIFTLKFSSTAFSINKNCVEYAENHTICTSMEACKHAKCAEFTCESIPAIHFRNIAVILNKRLHYRPSLKKRLDRMLFDPLQTSIFMQKEPGAYCGQENKLLHQVRVKVMASEGVLQQLLRKAFFTQQRFLYARDDCLNKCKVFGIDLGCEMVSEDDLEVIKTAVFKRLQHMVFFQCGEFPMLMVAVLLLVLILTIILICELAVGISRFKKAEKKLQETIKESATEADPETQSASTTKSTTAE